MIVLRPSLLIRPRRALTTVRTLHDLNETAPWLTIGLEDLRRVGLPPRITLQLYSVFVIQGSSRVWSDREALLSFKLLRPPELAPLAQASAAPERR